MEGPAWAGLSLTFSFPTLATQFTGYSGGEPSTNFEALNTTQQDAVRAIFASISSFTNLTFTELTGADAASAVLRFGMTDDTETAHAYLPTPSELGGDSWYRNTGNTYDAPIFGNYAWDTFQHEIGHTLGLGHPHESSPPMPGDRDWMAYTVMSYRSSANSSAELGYFNETWSFPQSFMMEDIAALQFLYGANYNLNAGNSVYKWDPATGQMLINGVGQTTPGGNRIFFTVWDGGGIDTYDFSNHNTYGHIDLRPGGWNLVSSPQMASLGGGGLPPGNVANALLFEGDTRSLIENVIGTQADDLIYGNDVANVLSGHTGSDTIHGLLGDDTLYGNEGIDWLHGEEGNDSLYGGANVDLLHGGIGNDSLFGGDEADQLYGEDGADSLEGGLGNDGLLGGAGDDYLAGGGGDDSMLGGDGNDALVDLEGNNGLDGAAGDDHLTAGSGNDLIDGGAGLDVMTGGAGNDVYSIDNAGDQVIELAGGGTDTVQTIFSYVAPGVIENVRLMDISTIGYTGPHRYTGPISATGNSLDNELWGNSEANTLDGAAGKDKMSGGLGDDTYYVDNVYDTVTDYENGGSDTVYSSVSFILASTPAAPADPYAGASLLPPPKYAVETLVLTGTANLDGTGSEIANTLRGNVGNNYLDGKEGNDTLIGGVGSDAMLGREGADVYLYTSIADSFGQFAVESWSPFADWLGDFEHGTDLIDLRPLEITSLSFEVDPVANRTKVVIGTNTGIQMALKVAGVATTADFLYSLSSPTTPTAIPEPASAFALPRQWLPLSYTGGDGWHVGDFDGDGKDDVFRYVDGATGADVYLSNGVRFNEAGSWTGAGNGDEGWYVGDFDGDGKDDIFRYVDGVSGAQMFLSDGTSFDFAGSWTGAGTGDDGWYVADYNGDGKDDVLRYRQGDSGAEVFLSNGTSFDYAGSWSPAGNGDEGWYLGDFNGDGKDDVFRYREGVSGAEVFLSDGTGFTFAGSWTGAGTGEDGWYVADYNGDGKDDVLRYRDGSSGAEVFLSNGTSFAYAGSWSPAGNGNEGWSVGDFTGDGTADLLRVTASGTDVLI